MKRHPTTGKEVPDETARVEVYRYVRPRSTKWPRAHYIIGNPPFIGKRELRLQLGDNYASALRKSFPISENCDFVMYWWHVSAGILAAGKSVRFGLITTSQITGEFNAKIVEDHLYGDPPVSIVFAVPDHPWVDNKDGASVRIAMTCVAAGNLDGSLHTLRHVKGGTRREDSEEFSEGRGFIQAGLRLGANVREARRLKSNEGISAVGYQFNGRGFSIGTEDAARFINEDSALSAYLRPYVNGNDISQTPRRLFMFDLYGLSEARCLLSTHCGHSAPRAAPLRETRPASRAAMYSARHAFFGKVRKAARKWYDGVCSHHCFVLSAP